ncbi:MAG: TetR/AcrR family transcriptional regulator [Pseudomonadota bacterium]
MATQEERTRATRARLIAAFRASILDQGFEHATTQRLLDATGLSKGALYHHFKSKTELMEAVYEAESAGAITRAAEAVATTDSALARLKCACRAWLTEVKAEDVSLILFEIGPAALGLARARAIEDRLSIIAFERLLTEAAETGEIRPDPPRLIARLLNALMAEASIAQRQDELDAADTVMQGVDALLSTLKS